MVGCVALERRRLVFPYCLASTDSKPELAVVALVRSYIHRSTSSETILAPRIVLKSRSRATRFIPRSHSHCILDWYVLGFSNRFVWRCPTRHLLRGYDEHVSARHLDIEVGPVLPRPLPLSSPTPALTLLDLNANALDWTARRLRRYQPRACQANVLTRTNLGSEQFDSIGLNLLLHCLPGDLSTKSVIFRHIRPLLREGGVVFGSTVLGTGCHTTCSLDGCSLRTTNRGSSQYPR